MQAGHVGRHYPTVAVWHQGLRRQRQPLEASPLQTSPQPHPGEPGSSADAEVRPWRDNNGRDSESAGRSPRPQAPRRSEPEPIDVEPEVLDDPW